MKRENRNRFLFTAAAALVFVQSFVRIGHEVLFGELPSLISEGKFTITILIILVGLEFIEDLLISLYSSMVSGSKTSIRYSIEEEYLNRMFKVDISKIMSTHSGKRYATIERLSRLKSELYFIIVHLLSELLPIIVIVARITCAIGPVAILVIAAMISLNILISKIICKRYSRERFYDADTKASGIVTDVLMNIKTLRYIGKQTFTMKRVKDVHDDSLRESFMFKRSLGMSLSTMFMFIPMSIILYVIRRDISLVTYILVSMWHFDMITGIISNFVDNISNVKEAERELVDLTLDKTDKVVPPSSVKGGIHLKGITFGYEDNDIIFKSNFDISAGMRYCITGESGQGKSTLANLIAGVLKPIKGTLPTYQVYYLYQESECLDMSLRDNITFGDNISDEHVIEILTELGMGEWLSTLPDGLDTVLGERGTKVSSGQKQRINIARAILRMESSNDDELIILDEPTSNLDDETEEKVCRIIDRVCKQTLLIITHRPAIAGICDKHVEVKDHIFNEVE